MNLENLLSKISSLLPAVIFITGERIVVQGSSMHSELSSGEYVLFDRLAYQASSPRRGEVVLIDQAYSHPLIKRIIGLPGERISIDHNQIWIDDHRLTEPYLSDTYVTSTHPNITLGEGEWFVLGDARGSSTDSRTFGPIKLQTIRGRAWLVYWPPHRSRLITVPNYELSS